MINEEHVKELYQAASYDMNHQQEYQQVRRYFRSDYINREILKSIFTGTFAYMIFCTIWIIVNGEEFVEQINNIDYITELGLEIGQYVFIEKGGGVIPKVTGVDYERNIQENITA